MRLSDAPSDVILGELFGTDRLARHGRHLARTQTVVETHRRTTARGAIEETALTLPGTERDWEDQVIFVPF